VPVILRVVKEFIGEMEEGGIEKVRNEKSASPDGETGAGQAAYNAGVLRRLNGVRREGW